DGRKRVRVAGAGFLGPGVARRGGKPRDGGGGVWPRAPRGRVDENTHGTRPEWPPPPPSPPPPPRRPRPPRPPPRPRPAPRAAAARRRAPRRRSGPCWGGGRGGCAAPGPTAPTRRGP